jgi:hypothetical protein
VWMQDSDEDGYNSLHAPVAQLDQSIWLRTRGSGVRVSPGAPLFCDLILTTTAHISLKSFVFYREIQHAPQRARSRQK